MNNTNYEDQVIEIARSNMNLVPEMEKLLRTVYRAGYNECLRNIKEKHYTSKEWVGLTDEEIYDCEEEVGMPQYEISSADLYAFAQAIEKTLKEKNT